MKVLIVDNYDSFTWNLVQPLAAGGADCVVVRNDAASLAEVVATHYDRIIISPGPFGPAQAGISLQLVRELGPAGIPILGVCLGMQVIAAAAGAEIVESGAPVHGKQRQIRHRGGALFHGISTAFPAGLYHSLVVAPESVPDSLEVTADTAEGVIMGCRLRGTAAQGVLFHPESFLTPDGGRLLDNFVSGAADHVD